MIQQKNEFIVTRINDAQHWQQKVADLAASINYPDHLAIAEEHFDIGLIITDTDDKIGAACVVYHNKYWSHNDMEILGFGNLLCLNDQVIFNAIAGAVIAYAAEQQYKKIIGPINGSTWSNYRVALESNNEPYFLDLTHPPYYTELFTQSKLSLDCKYYTFRDDELKIDFEKYHLLKEKARTQNIEIRNIDPADFEAELKLIHTFSLEAFSGNYLYSPIAFESFRDKYLSVLPVLKPELVYMSMQQDKLVGLLFAVQNISDKGKRGIVLKTIARLPAYDGLAGLLGAELYLQLKKLGYEYALHAFMNETNKSVNLSRQFNGSKVKGYGLYGALIKYE